MGVKSLQFALSFFSLFRTSFSILSVIIVAVVIVLLGRQCGHFAGRLRLSRSLFDLTYCQLELVVAQAQPTQH